MWLRSVQNEKLVRVGESHDAAGTFCRDVDHFYRRVLYIPQGSLLSLVQETRSCLFMKETSRAGLQPPSSSRKLFSALCTVCHLPTPINPTDIVHR